MMACLADRVRGTKLGAVDRSAGRVLAAGLLCASAALLNCGGHTRAQPGGLAGTEPSTGGSGQAGRGGQAAGAVEPATAGSRMTPPLSCPPPSCTDPNDPYYHPWREVVEPAEGCAYCGWISSCRDATCLYGDSLGQPIELPPLLDCPPGYEVGRLAGACCFSCVRNQDPITPPVCDQPCLEEPLQCAFGYHEVQAEGHCCPKCFPDPSYCTTDTDCALARRPANCCACVVAVSLRLLSEDACFTPLESPRPTADTCAPDHDCTLIDCGCPAQEPTVARCVANRCTAI